MNLRCISLIFVLSILGLFGVSASAQEPAPAPAQLPFITAVEVAEQVYASVEKGDNLPDNFSITLPNGASLAISAEQALGLLAEAAGACQKNFLGPLALPPEEILPPVRIEESDPLASPRPVTLSAEMLLAEALPLADFAYAFGVYPSAVWVGSERLSVEEYMQGVASVIKFLADFERLPENVRVVPCHAPASWIFTKASLQDATSPIPPLGNFSGGEPGAAPQPPASPTLSVFPENGARLYGEISIVASLEPMTGHTAVFFILDGELMLISNRAPFALTLDSQDLALGPHRLLVRAEKSDGTTVAKKEVTFFLMPAQENGETDSFAPEPEIGD